MSYPGGWRPHIESALCLDLRQLFALGALRADCKASGTWRWTRNGETSASIGYRAKLGTDGGSLALDYFTERDGERRNITCTVPLVTLPRHYGGRIWYFVCPYTGRRARKLYKWGPIDWFCHREAIKPKSTYASQRVGGSDRNMAQRWALRRMMGDNASDLFGEPLKPKWMRWRTFERYAARDAELANREAVYMARLLGRMGVKDAAAIARGCGI
ncbi:MAG TPA: hypothetical protein VFN09_11165 [Rhodanobacteraceae bacterium]|nr:hypothetical protein [Rhodanobacteraceae bacterium]